MAVATLQDETGGAVAKKKRKKKIRQDQTNIQQTNKQIHKQTNIHTYKQINKQTQTDKQTNERNIIIPIVYYI